MEIDGELDSVCAPARETSTLQNQKDRLKVNSFGVWTLQRDFNKPDSLKLFMFYSILFYSIRDDLCSAAAWLIVKDKSALHQQAYDILNKCALRFLERVLENFSIVKNFQSILQRF